MKPCILLIEDDQDMRDLVSGHLEHSGFDVQRADDGIKGQALALQYTPDLILLDLMLPKVDGLTLCQRLKYIPLQAFHESPDLNTCMALSMHLLEVNQDRGHSMILQMLQTALIRVPLTPPLDWDIDSYQACKT